MPSVCRVIVYLCGPFQWRCTKSFSVVRLLVLEDERLSVAKYRCIPRRPYRSVTPSPSSFWFSWPNNAIYATGLTKGLFFFSRFSAVYTAAVLLLRIGYDLFLPPLVVGSWNIVNKIRISLLLVQCRRHCLRCTSNWRIWTWPSAGASWDVGLLALC